MTEPDWFVLMQRWVAQNHGDRGITLPFLVGALAYKANNSQPSADDARALLNEMITKPVDNHVTEIGWCSSLGAPILTASGAPSSFTSRVGFNHPTKNELCLVFAEELQRHWNLWDADSLMKELIYDAEEAIKDRKYSRDSKSQSYREFEAWEITFIQDSVMTE